jgi:UDP-glucose 4-epimerase
VRVLVTGGAGFIGGNLSGYLLDRGHDVIVLDDLSTGDRSNVPGGARFVEGSILDESTLAMLCRQADAVVHLAARPSVPRSVSDPLASNEMNVSGTLKVLIAARDAGQLYTIVASSSSVYGAGGDPAAARREDARCAPISPYGVSKLAAESYTEVFRAVYDLPAVAFRFFNVFGPLQSSGHAYAAVIPAFIDAALRNDRLVVHGDGRQSRDFTYVMTVCEAITRSLEERLESAGPVNLALGQSISLLHVIAELERQLGRQLAVDHVSPRPGDIAHSRADSSRLLAMLPGLSSKPFAECLGETLMWNRNALGRRGVVEAV